MLLMAQEDAELADRLRELRHYIDGLELEFSDLAAEFAASRQWENQGSESAIDWLRGEQAVGEPGVRERDRLAPLQLPHDV